MTTKNRLSGIILSGGQNIRMGKNKAFVEIEGIPIIQRIHTLFEKLFQEIIIVTNQKELFKNFSSKIYCDLIPKQGVLGGLYTGLFFSSFQYSFCVACDMPFLKESVIEYLIKNIQNDDVIVPRTKDGLQPLHAIYSKRCLDPIKHIMDEGKYKILEVYPMVSVKIIEQAEFTPLDPMNESFVNVNTPAELLSVQKRKNDFK